MDDQWPAKAKYLYLYLIDIFEKCLFEMYFNQKSAWPIVEITKQNRIVLHKEIYIW